MTKPSFSQVLPSSQLLPQCWGTGEHDHSQILCLSTGCFRGSRRQARLCLLSSFCSHHSLSRVAPAGRRGLHHKELYLRHKHFYISDQKLRNYWSNGLVVKRPLKPRRALKKSGCCKEKTERAEFGSENTNRNTYREAVFREFKI